MPMKLTAWFWVVKGNQSICLIHKLKIIGLCILNVYVQNIHVISLYHAFVKLKPQKIGARWYIVYINNTCSFAHVLISVFYAPEKKTIYWFYINSLSDCTWHPNMILQSCQIWSQWIFDSEMQHHVRAVLWSFKHAELFADSINVPKWTERKNTLSENVVVFPTHSSYFEVRFLM